MFGGLIIWHVFFCNVFFTGMLDHIIVETGGVKMPLNHLAVVSVLDSKTLSINPYDPNVIIYVLKSQAT